MSKQLMTGDQHPEVCPGWQKGPLPENTWGWGGVVPHGLGDNLGGFCFADFHGDRVKVIGAKEGEEWLEAHEIKYFNNCLGLAPTE